MKTKGHTIYRSETEFQKNGKGIRLPGVTTITGLLAKPALIPWANRLGLEGIDVAKFVDDKARIGELAHLMITNYLTSQQTDTSDFDKNQIEQAENCVLSFYEWEKKHKIETIFVEKPLVDSELGFGGTCDIYAEIDGKKELIDLKTGKAIWPEHEIQVSAYEQLLIKNGFAVDSVRILNIPRAEDESFDEKNIPQLRLLWNYHIFLALVSVYKYRKLLAKP